MRWTTHNKKYQKIDYSNNNEKEVLDENQFSTNSCTLFAIFTKQSKQKEMDLVVQNEFCSQTKMKCIYHDKYLSKIPLDY